MKKPPERIAAELAGESFYMPAKACKSGHLVKRRTATGRCTACLAEDRRRYMIARPGLEAKWARVRRAKDPTGHRAEVKRWRNKNKERAKAAFDRWRAENIEHVRANCRIAMSRYRSRKAKNGGSFTLEDIEKLYEQQEGKCACCQNQDDKMEIDHRIPVSRGGMSEPENLQLLCLPCNRSKGNTPACRLNHAALSIH